MPADTVVALGAFLAGHGILDPWTVFAVTWVGNVVSAALVYFVGRHYGRAFFTGRIGRRLLSEATLAHIEAAYARHGSYGIFFSRLLPVWRGVVPPFAGVARVPPWRALLPIALASALWYGAIIFLVVRLAPTLDQALATLGRVNRVLGIAALALVLIAIVLVIRRRRLGP
ncbi:MAG TPA: DedA family protein [Gemmatimonadales bacterium]|nr:DedA family protein [Gemmatimonadales bacterium]